uniref:Zinc knuckle CX2CX4HX4C n=1 Tax=Tanacetum cinerariifolium TaxID=118510 RepID=A0A699K6L1_TANCI|nr:hypothetical protein [Tanacetum cinerariifolium]
MIELQADMELKDTIMVAMPKVAGEGFNTCNIRVEYEKKPPRYACCRVFGRIQEECPKYISAWEVKNLKKPTQTPKGVLVGLKVGFKSAKQVYRPVSKKPSANTSENQKKMYNLLKRLVSQTLLNSVENDVVIGTNGGIQIWLVKRPILVYLRSRMRVLVVLLLLILLRKLTRLIIDGKVTFANDELKPLDKIDSLGDYDSEDEVALVDNEMASFLAKKDG